MAQTTGGDVVDPAGYYLQEWLPGELATTMSTGQIEAIFGYLGRYDRALALLASPDWLRRADHLFVQVIEPEFLINQLPRLFKLFAPATWDLRPVRTALALLDRSQDRLAGFARQLVHGDHGPDNMIIQDGRPLAVIDFTPFHASRLFSVGTALYWYYVYRAAARRTKINDQQIESALDHYQTLSAEERACWPDALLGEALRRLATPLAVYEDALATHAPAAPLNLERLQQRYAALSVLVERDEMA